MCRVRLLFYLFLIFRTQLLALFVTWIQLRSVWIFLWHGVSIQRHPEAYEPKCENIYILLGSWWCCMYSIWKYYTYQCMYDSRYTIWHIMTIFRFIVFVFNATFNNCSVISRRFLGMLPVLLVRLSWHQPVSRNTNRATLSVKKGSH